MGLKKLVGGALVSLGALLPLNSVSAQEREIKIDLNNPVTNFETNSNDWYSLDQLTGKGSDYLYRKWQDHFATRLLAVTTDFCPTYFFKFGSHELGHVGNAKRYGDMTLSYHWKSFYDLNKNYVKRLNYIPAFEEDMEAVIGGLNHDEYNSYLTFRNNLDKISVHDGMSFLLNKWYDVVYILVSPAAEEGGDPDNYISFLNDKEINLTKADYFAQAMLADALTMQTYDSLDVVLNYLFGNPNTSRKPLRMFFDGKVITPPIVNQYITTKGSFYNVTSVFDALGSHPVELSFATPVNFIGDGQVKTYRAGGQVNKLRLGNYKLSPFYYVDTDLSFNHTGYSAGLQVNKSLRENVDLRLKIENNNKDLLENVVKGENKGWNFVVGFDIAF